jgi:hypothetical protein
MSKGLLRATGACARNGSTEEGGGAVRDVWCGLPGCRGLRGVACGVAVCAGRAGPVSFPPEELHRRACRARRRRRRRGARRARGRGGGAPASMGARARGARRARARPARARAARGGAVARGPWAGGGGAGIFGREGHRGPLRPSVGGSWGAVAVCGRRRVRWGGGKGRILAGAPAARAPWGAARGGTAGGARGARRAQTQTARMRGVCRLTCSSLSPTWGGGVGRGVGRGGGRRQGAGRVSDGTRRELSRDAAPAAAANPRRRLPGDQPDAGAGPPSAPPAPWRRAAPASRGPPSRAPQS